MKITILLNGSQDLSLKSDIEGWYQIEVDAAKEFGIDLKDYKLMNVTHGMAERGKNPKHNMKFVDAYSLDLAEIFYQQK